jgi:serine protease
MNELAEIVEVWRAGQGGAGEPARGVRFVVESGRRASDIAAIAAQLLQVELTVSALFADQPALARFHALDIPRVPRLDRADLFEVAATLRRALDAETVEPDLGTDYFQPEPPLPAEGAVEGIDFTFWCWARKLPADADWAVKKTHIPEAWQFAQAQERPVAGAGIVVFQPDTGVVDTHTALPPGVVLRPGAANFVEPGQPPIDPRTGGGNPGHGTATFSVIASPAAGSMRGAAPAAMAVPLRCIESVAVFDQSPVAQAISHAERHNAHVITMSLGGVPSSALHAAARQAVASNVIVVAAAGNCVGEVVWPARYDEVIAVGGINESFKPWQGSCRGRSVAVSAPAEFVLRADGKDTAVPPAAVSGGQGTSFAVAMTAGIAALWLAFHGRDALIAQLPPGRTLQDQFRRLLRRSAHTPDGFDTRKYGAGIVDALALLKLDPAIAWQGGEAELGGDEHDSLRSLVAAAFGDGGAEAALPALEDRQHHAELACAALDRLRAAQTQRAQAEALPPPLLSPALRSKLDAPLQTAGQEAAHE